MMIRFQTKQKVELIESEKAVELAEMERIKVLLFSMLITMFTPTISNIFVIGHTNSKPRRIDNESSSSNN